MRKGANIVSLKQNKVKCNKMRCAWCKRETVFWGSNGTMDISCETEVGSCKPRGQTFPSHYFVTWANLLTISQMVKNLPVMQKTEVRSPDQEDPLEKRMATHPSILAWRIPWTEELGRLQFMGLHRVRQDWCTQISRCFRSQLIHG